MTGTGKHLLLIGGGHAHVAVLADWIEHGLPCAGDGGRATLLTPDRFLRYSGTVPGWIAGQYERDFGLVDLAGLAARAGVELVPGKCAAVDPEARVVTTEAGERIAFDVASFDTGGVGRAPAVLGKDERVLDIRPISGFVERFEAAPATARIAVVGGGAGGVELAFALRNRAGVPVSGVTLITGKQGLLPAFSSRLRGLVARELGSQDIAVIAEDACIRDGALMVGEDVQEPNDLIVAALGSAAPDWPRAGGLACDAAGFIAVDRHQRSTSHGHIFAVGDVAARQDVGVPHSGVHAVHAGPVLAANLRSAMRGDDPQQSYIPRPASLYVLSTGRGEAIASYGQFAAQGRWAARLKHWIDNRWLSKYAALAQNQ